KNRKLQRASRRKRRYIRRIEVSGASSVACRCALNAAESHSLAEGHSEAHILRSAERGICDGELELGCSACRRRLGRRYRSEYDPINSGWRRAATTSATRGRARSAAAASPSTSRERADE